MSAIFQSLTRGDLMNWEFSDSQIPALLFKQHHFLFWGLRLIGREVVRSQAQPHPVETCSSLRRFPLQAPPLRCNHHLPWVWMQTFNRSWAIITLLASLWPSSVHLCSITLLLQRHPIILRTEVKASFPDLGSAHFSDLLYPWHPYCLLCSSLTSWLFPNWSLS